MYTRFRYKFRLRESLVLGSQNLPRSPLLDQYRFDLFISSDSHRVLPVFHILANIALAFNLWLSVIELLIFTLLCVFIVVHCIVVLTLPDTKTAGILTLIVYIPLLFRRPIC